MEQKLKLPAQCAAIPQEELESICGGAPAWFENTVTAVKNPLRPAKPYLKAAWEVLMVTVAGIKELDQVDGYGMIVISSLKGIKKCLKEFGQ